MNIQAEKIELIKLIANVDSEKVLKKIKNILNSEKKLNETERILANPAMVKRLEESRQQIQDGKGVKVSLDDIYNVGDAKYCVLNHTTSFSEKQNIAF